MSSSSQVARWWRLSVMVVVTLAAGCDSGPGYPTVRLSGNVTIDDTPIREGKIVFLPTEPQHGPAVGVEIAAGKYDCPAAPTGKLLVQIHALRDTGKKLNVMGKQIPELLSIVPSHARSGIELEVVAENLNLNFTLRNDQNKRGSQ